MYVKRAIDRIYTNGIFIHVGAPALQNISFPGKTNERQISPLTRSEVQDLYIYNFFNYRYEGVHKTLQSFLLLLISPHQKDEKIVKKKKKKNIYT
jgi:hypothetical protein